MTNFFVIARHYLSSRGTKRSRLNSAGKQKREIAALRSPESCHREERSDLGCEGLTNIEWRDCRAPLAMTVGGARYEPISPLFSVIARHYLSSRGTKRSRLNSADKQRRERLPRSARNDSRGREERGDLSCEGLTNSQKRDCFAG